MCHGWQSKPHRKVYDGGGGLTPPTNEGDVGLLHLLVMVMVEVEAEA